jgi:hypothetical protein
MISRSIAQVIADETGVLAHSDNFDENWRADIERVIAGFGLPANVQAPECLFAVPLNRRHVAVVSVAGRRFRFLILSKPLYNVIPDPFAIVERFPPKWDERSPPETLEWPEQPLPHRTIAMLDHILKHGDGPFLYGACQTLVDSGRILLVRELPPAQQFRDLWMLLPDSTRRTTWPATFAYSTALGFGLVAMPVLPEVMPPGYLTEDQTRDYPESRYERALQVAVESGDQRGVDSLFARRSSAETLRLAIWIILAAGALSIGMRILMAW